MVLNDVYKDYLIQENPPFIQFIFLPNHCMGYNVYVVFKI